ncbi:MAG: hypothetical protein WC321_00590 [Candidatus Omnitrophota bacterium]|jgi:hypothetical protein
MPVGIPVFDRLMVILLWLVPLVFIEGILLLMTSAESYRKIEKALGKELSGVKTRLIPRIETNLYGFSEWLIKRKAIIGLICIVYAVVFLVLLLKM